MKAEKILKELKKGIKSSIKHTEIGIEEGLKEKDYERCFRCSNYRWAYGRDLRRIKELEDG